MKLLLAGVVLGVLLGLLAGYVRWGGEGEWVHASNFTTLYHTKTGEMKAY